MGVNDVVLTFKRCLGTTNSPLCKWFVYIFCKTCKEMNREGLLAILFEGHDKLKKLNKTCNVISLTSPKFVLYLFCGNTHNDKDNELRFTFSHQPHLKFTLLTVQ